MSELSAGEGGTASRPAVCLGARGQGLTPSQMGTMEGFARRPELQMTSTVPAWNERSVLHRGAVASDVSVEEATGPHGRPERARASVWLVTLL